MFILSLYLITISITIQLKGISVSFKVYAEIFHITLQFAIFKEAFNFMRSQEQLLSLWSFFQISLFVCIDLPFHEEFDFRTQPENIGPQDVP